jgi:hypothetical protein
MDLFNGMSIRILTLALLIVMLLPLPAAYAQDDASWLYNQINGLRASLGLHGYAWNGPLNAAAQAHSEWMASTGIISHEGEFDRGPGDRALTFGYGGRWVSENIFGGLNASPQQAWNFWVNSASHYSAIAHTSKNEMGVGIATSGEGLVYYTLLVGEGSGVDAPPPLPEEAAAPQAVEVAGEAPPAQPQQSAPVEPPPPITLTPSATIASQTPTITWTPTYTWTPSPTASIPPPSATPIRLATARPLPTQTEVAILPSPTEAVLQLAPVDEEPETVLIEQDGFNVRQLLPIIIAAQVIGIGGVLWRLWTRRG